MFTVTKEIHFSYGHRLLDYDGKCSHPHGHNGKLEIEIAAETLDHRGMVVDFDDIKRTLKTWVDDHLDHLMILRKDDPLAAVLSQMKEPTFLMDSNPTAENIARIVYEHVAALGFPVRRVTLWETVGSFATYASRGT